jgi:hypothetical protein
VREFRVQVRTADGWRFITDRNGKFYTYESEATARRHGPTHAPRSYDPVSKRWVPVLDRFRIVYADIDWQPLDM